MKKSLIFVLILSVFAFGIVRGNVVRLRSLQADTGKVVRPEKSGSPQVEIIQDARIGALVEKHIAINEKQKGVSGYRIQLFFGSKRTDALEVKADFLAKYPDIGAYTEYNEPYFKVRVGDFRTHLEAQKFHKQISVDFPYAFIVEGLIILPGMEE